MRVMTRNLYIGTGLGPLFRTRDVSGLPAVIGALWREVQASEAPARLAAVANEIAATRPDLVGLQEVARYEVGPALGSGSETTLDYLALLTSALEDRGLPYSCAAAQENLDLELPDDRGQLVRFTDRDVILARGGVVTRSARGHRFATCSEHGTGSVSLRLPRGWMAVEADVGGETVCFVNVHLEHSAFGGVQEAQARELVEALSDEHLPTVLVGDINSSADAPGGTSFRLLRDAGFSDAWSAVRGAEAGDTCCFSSDLRGGGLRSRVDVVLFRGALSATAAERVGAAPSGRTPSGRWPSDHAGVVATLAAGGPRGLP